VEGNTTGGRTVEEELDTSVVDDEQIDYELEDLHGRYVALPLSIAPYTSISVRRARMNATYPEPPSTGSSVVVISASSYGVSTRSRERRSV
jgi:hypothetical protein